MPSIIRKFEMTTYTIQGFKISYYGDVISGLTSSMIKIVTPKSDFSYSITGQDPDSQFPYIEVVDNEPYNMYLDGVEFFSVIDWDVDEDLAGFVNWGGGTSYFIDFWDAETNQDYLFQMGGAPVATTFTPLEAQAFLNSITAAGQIASGPFAPGQNIDFGNFTHVTVTENDVIQGDVGANVYRGGVGRDKIYGAGGKDKLFGEKGNDRLAGGGGNDKLVGGGGKDKLFGDAGNDKLIGGKGDDIMRGGKGADMFIYAGRNNEGSDTINGFQDGVDIIKIGNGVTYADLSFHEIASGTHVRWNATEILVKGMTEADFSAADFDLA